MKTGCGHSDSALQRRLWPQAVSGGLSPPMTALVSDQPADRRSRRGGCRTTAVTSGELVLPTRSRPSLSEKRPLGLAHQPRACLVYNALVSAYGRDLARNPCSLSVDARSRLRHRSAMRPRSN
jgi:hypothetical protein